MKVHFREQYGSKGDEILYVTPEGKSNTHIHVPFDGIELLKSQIYKKKGKKNIYDCTWPTIQIVTGIWLAAL